MIHNDFSHENFGFVADSVSNVANTELFYSPKIWNRFAHVGRRVSCVAGKEASYSFVINCLNNALLRNLLVNYKQVICNIWSVADVSIIFLQRLIAKLITIEVEVCETFLHEAISIANDGCSNGSAQHNPRNTRPLLGVLTGWRKLSRLSFFLANSLENILHQKVFSAFFIRDTRFLALWDRRALGCVRVAACDLSGGLIRRACVIW